MDSINGCLEFDSDLRKEYLRDEKSMREYINLLETDLAFVAGKYEELSRAYTNLFNLINRKKENV